MRRLSLLMMTMVALSACGTPQVAQVPVASPSVAATAVADPTPSPVPTPATLNNEQIAEQIRPSTVRVIAEFGETAIDTEGLGAGTGIVYDTDNGYVITNAHVVEGASVVKIALADSTKTRSARVVGRSQCDDLAVLSVENTQDLTAATLGQSSDMKVGAEVVALGYPLSFDLGTDISVNAGSVSQLNAQLGKFEDLVKIDAAINPGNSGGPLVNRKGEVIGINSLGIEGAQNQNYAIAMSQAEPIVRQLEQGKNRHFIGLNLVPNEYADYFGTDQGMAIVGVASGSPAAQGGVQPADLLLKMEGKAITSEQAVCDILRSHADGDQLKVTVFRASTGEVLEGELSMGKIGAADENTPKLAVIGSINDAEAVADDSAVAPEEAQADPAPAEAEAATNEDATLLVESTFDDGDPGTWPVGEDDGYSATVADGAYTLNLATDNMYLFLGPEEAADVADGAIAASVRPEGQGLAGIMIRSSETDAGRSMYACWINNDGQFGCSKDVNNSWSVVVEPQASAAIKPNEYNSMLLIAFGNQFNLEINDEQVASFTDDALTSGTWGVYAETTPGNFKAHYDEIAIAQP